MIIDERYIRKNTGRKIYACKSCNSTFDEIGDNDAIIALSQKFGAGRGDHTFFSPPGGLYIVTRENGLAIDAHTLTPAVGLAVHDAIKAVTGRDTQLKWVNDVMYNDKKVAGILVRSPRRGEYLIGVGINYFTDAKVLEKAGLTSAGTLNADISTASRFCAELLLRIHRAAIENFDFTRYNELCRTVGKNVTFTRDGIKVGGYAESVERDGSLIVRIGSATVAVDAGEVSIVRESDSESTDLKA